MSSRPPERLFVYGTLMPGQPRWPLLQPYAVGAPEATTVAGTLWDTGRGYPALDAAGGQDPAASGVAGVVVTLDPARRDEALAAMDHVEGTGRGLYRRERLVVDGRPTWVYVVADPSLRADPIESWPRGSLPPAEYRLGDGRA